MVNLHFYPIQQIAQLGEAFDIPFGAIDTLHLRLENRLA